LVKGEEAGRAEKFSQRTDVEEVLGDVREDIS